KQGEVARMKMTGQARWLTTLAVGALTFAACGGGGGKGSDALFDLSDDTTAPTTTRASDNTDQTDDTKAPTTTVKRTTTTSEESTTTTEESTTTVELATT